MRNPWLKIPLADYEGHMSLPGVAQAQLLAEVFDRMLRNHHPLSVAVIGCAGGNGFERIDPSVTRRVVGVDLNASYVEQAKARFHDRLPTLELIAGDVQTEEVVFPPVDLAFLGLVLEYVDVEIVLKRSRSFLRNGGILGTVIQLPCSSVATVTPSPFASLQSLGAFMRLVRPGHLKSLAEHHGYREIFASQEAARGGKHFQIQEFRLLTRERAEQ
jgi:ubiquinone/menaquinone biosynthesis C-methylase UbiE